VSAGSQNIIDEGARLKQVIKDLGMTYVDFGSKVKLSNQSVHRYFKNNSIKRTTIARFCKALGISLEEFYDWKGPKREPGQKFHYGERLKNLIVERDIKRNKLAEKMGISRRALYNIFEREVFDPHLLRKVCEALPIHESEFLLDANLQDPDQSYETAEQVKWREKYYQLLEIHNELLRENAALRARLQA